MSAAASLVGRPHTSRKRGRPADRRGPPELPCVADFTMLSPLRLLTLHRDDDVTAAKRDSRPTGGPNDMEFSRERKRVRWNDGFK